VGYRDGTTHVIFELVDFISKLAALVPIPRVNLTRFHGVFAPNSKCRSKIICCANSKKISIEKTHRTEMERRGAMCWAMRLKRAFGIDIETCERCSGRVKIVACIETPEVIKRILSHLELSDKSAQIKLPIHRAPPFQYVL